jgi:hypothetical protein
MYAVLTTSGGMIHIPSFKKIGSGVLQKLLGGDTYIPTDTQTAKVIS